MMNSNIANYYGGAIQNTIYGSFTVNNSIITNNTSVNNAGGGGIVNGGNFIMTNSTLTNNTAGGSFCTGGGIENDSGTFTLNYNRIYNNSARYGNAISCFGGSVDATNNWWGSNTPLTIPNLFSGGNVNANPWIVLRISSSPELIGTGESSIISVNLKYNSNGQDISSLGAVPDTGVLFSSSIGSLNPINSTISQNTTFTAGSSPVFNAVSATVDSQTVNTTIRVLESF